MKHVKYILTLFGLFFGLAVFSEPLQAGISIDEVPNSIYGTWRVVAKMDKQSGSTYFKPNAIDFWNLSRVGDVINLNNPFTGANASVKVDYVEGNLIRFTKTGGYDDNKILIDTVDLKLEGDSFTGVNYITLETYSNFEEKKLVRKDSAIYLLKGEKIFGESITGK